MNSHLKFFLRANPQAIRNQPDILSSSTEEDTFSTEDSEFPDNEDESPVDRRPAGLSVASTKQMMSFYDHKKARMDQNNNSLQDSWHQFAKEKILRVRSKLEGTDIDPALRLSVQEQIDALIDEATDPENLSSLYCGWCPFW